MLAYYIISIEQFQAHQHDADLRILNTTSDGYNTDGDGLTGDADSAFDANVEAQNILDETQPNVPRGSVQHDHRITKPFTYSNNFTYSFPARTYRWMTWNHISMLIQPTWRF